MAKANKPQPTNPSPSTPAINLPNHKRGFWCGLWRWLGAPLLMVVLSFQLLVLALLAVWHSQPANNSMFMFVHRLQGGQVTQVWVDYDKIAKSVKQAVIVSEDAKFSQHDGFDFDSIERAIEKNQQAKNQQQSTLRGGSTISQQLAKNLFLTSHRSYVRKAQEALITVMMEKMWSKRRILEVYLNVVEFGEGIYGIEAAAQHYYGKSAKALSREESAFLACLLPNPKYYQKNRHVKRLRAKQKIILQRMPSAVLPKQE